MSPIRTYLKAGLDRARIARYNHKVSSDAAFDRREHDRIDVAKAGGILYI